MTGLEKPLECGFESLGPVFVISTPPSPLLSFHDFSPTVSPLNPNHCFSRVKFKSKPHGSANTHTVAKWKRVWGNNKDPVAGDPGLSSGPAGNGTAWGLRVSPPGVGSEGPRSNCVSD